MANRLKLTSKRKTLFLERLSSDPNVLEAAKSIAISPTCLYDHKKKDPEFREAWDAAEKLGALTLLEEAQRRAVKGVPKGVWHQGKLVGTEIQYSDTLLIFLIKKHFPEFRERYGFDVEVTGSFQLLVDTGEPDAEA